MEIATMEIATMNAPARDRLDAADLAPGQERLTESTAKYSAQNGTSAANVDTRATFAEQKATLTVTNPVPIPLIDAEQLARRRG